MVQRKVARFDFNDYHRYSCVTNMLNQLKWVNKGEKIYYHHVLQDYS